MSSAPFTTSANENQLKAIQTVDGPLLIIAGPGSGKTFTLVERIVYLITQRHVSPENLLVVTFTDKAARELTTRVSTRLNKLGIRFNLNEMFLGTFHSICLRWLETYRDYTRLKRNFILLDQFDQQFFLYKRLSDYEAIPDFNLLIDPKSSSWRKSEELLKLLNKVSEEALDIATLQTAAHPEVQVLGRLYERYQQHLEEENALDFSTIQYEAYRLLSSRPAVLAELRSKINYAMVDEYQDTNTIQDLILNLLTGEHQNLCVVGDDDQGLYRFRGATIQNILQFKDKFSADTCEQVDLTTNYRSHPTIIEFYNQWMQGQSWHDGDKRFRFNKTIEPEKKTFPSVPTVLKLASDDQDAWHEDIFQFLHTLRDKGTLTNWNQVAFLFRSVKNPKVIALAQYLEAHGIAVYSPRSNQFFEREEIRLLIGALIFLFPQFPSIRALKSGYELPIWNYYDNECFKRFAEALRRPENADLLKWAVPIAKRHNSLSENADYAFTGLFYQLLRFPLFSRYLENDLLLRGLPASRPMHNLAVFSQLLGKFEYLHHISVLNPRFLTQNLRDLFNHFLRFLKDGGIDEYEDEAEYAPSGCVSFLTIHQAKGLEFPVVIVGSLDTTPRKQYTDLDVILGEHYLARPPFEPLAQTKFYDFRRLYYTAFSRAQNLLVLSCFTQGGSHPSPSKYFAGYMDPLSSWQDPKFDPALLPLASVKDVDLKREYSFTSHLTLFENCAEQYRFLKELEFAPIRTSPILFGALVHQTIEDIHKTVLRGEDHKLNEAQVASWFDANYAYLTKRERVYLAPRIKDIALEHVLRYFRRQAGRWERIKESEVDVSLVKDEYILSGKIDLIVGEDGTVELVDFKSEKKPDVNDPKDRDRLDRYRRQLEVYSHIVEERTGETVSKMHLYYTGEDAGNPYISFPLNRASIQKTVATFDAVVHRIEQKDFAIPDRPTRICRECDLRSYCDTKNWSFRK